jgi:hypothetical protein
MATSRRFSERLDRRRTFDIRPETFTNSFLLALLSWAVQRAVGQTSQV